MRQPYKGNTTRYGYTLQEFGGINRLVRINENEFSDMENMSSAQYPLLSVREKRQLLRTEEVGAEVVGFLCKEALVRIIRKNGECKLYINKNEVSDFYLSAADDMCPKNIVGMGAYIVIFPDKKFVNLLDTDDKGSLENYWSEDDGSTVTTVVPCTVSGEEYKVTSTGSAAPSSPSNGDVWVDTSQAKTVYKIWDSSTSQWQSVSTTYLKISNANIGKGLKKWDAVKLSGFDNENWHNLKDDGTAGSPATERVREQLKVLNTEGIIIYEVAEDNRYIIVAGIVDKACCSRKKSTHVRVERICPEMDFVIECNNRLWGCKYGMVGGKTVNEIYACRQGDFKNWYAYIGVSTDSYAVTVGSDGPFTGAVTFGGYPLFFKEDVLHKVYGNIPANYQLLTTVCRGVEKGMDKSIVTVNNTLFYKSPVDFCAYDGSLPLGISQKLTRCNFKEVVGGGIRDKVYWSVVEEDDSRSLLVFDASTSTWMKETGENIRAFARDGHILNYLVFDEESNQYSIKSVNKDYDTKMIIDGDEYPKQEKEIRWYCESGDIGFSDIYQKYVKKLTIRAKVHEDASFNVYLSCDGGLFRQIGETITKSGVYSVSIPITPERCDNFRYRLEGTGQVEIISLYFEFDEGSDKR